MWQKQPYVKKSLDLFLLYLDNRYFLFLEVLYERSCSTKGAAQRSTFSVWTVTAKKKKKIMIIKKIGLVKKNQFTLMFFLWWLTTHFHKYNIMFLPVHQQASKLVSTFVWFVCIWRKKEHIKKEINKNFFQSRTKMTTTWLSDIRRLHIGRRFFYVGYCPISSIYSQYPAYIFMVFLGKTTTPKNCQKNCKNILF